VNSSWFGFLYEYIVPSIAEKIKYNTVVESVDYTKDQVVIETRTGQFTADKVIVSVPLKILQDGDVTFRPGLPNEKQEAIDDTPNLGKDLRRFLNSQRSFMMTIMNSRFVLQLMAKRSITTRLMVKTRQRIS